MIAKAFVGTAMSEMQRLMTWRLNNESKLMRSGRETELKTNMKMDNKSNFDSDGARNGPIHADADGMQVTELIQLQKEKRNFDIYSTIGVRFGGECRR